MRKTFELWWLLTWSAVIVGTAAVETFAGEWIMLAIGISLSTIYLVGKRVGSESQPDTPEDDHEN
jgi:hypothetical protein